MPERRAGNGHRSRTKDAAGQAAREELLTEVATLYYVDHFTQGQIARQISRSVATVSRLLAEAEAKEIFEVRVRYPVPLAPELQAALVARFDLRVARVARVSPDEPHNHLSQVGDLAARYLTTLLADGAIVSVGWGTSVYEAVRAVKSAPYRDIRVVQGNGALGSLLPAIGTPLITQVLAERVNGTPHFLPAPLIVESTAIREALARDPQFKETLDLVGQSDIAVVGIGLADPVHAGLCRAGYLDDWGIERIRANGAVGDVMCEFFDIYGRIQTTDVSERVMGMRLADLHNTRAVIAVAGGADKAPAILGALRSGMVHVLITDNEAARRVLELADVYPCPGPAPAAERGAPASPANGPGRPNLNARRAILAATMTLLERAGYQSLTIEAIAAEAGVGPRLIYRWWPNKATLAVEAHFSGMERNAIDTGNLQDDLEVLLAPLLCPPGGCDRGPALAQRTLMAEAQLDREFRRAYLRHQDASRKPFVAALERARRRGEIDPGSNAETLVDLLLGACWHRLLLEHAPLDAAFAREVMETVIAGSRPALTPANSGIARKKVAP